MEDKTIHKFSYIVIILFFWIGVLKQGYLYELNYLFANLFLFTAVLISILTLRQVRLHLVHLLLFVIALLYWASILVAVDVEKAIFEAIRVTTLLPFAILVSALTKDHIMKIFRWLPYMGSFLVIVGVVFQMERQSRLESTLDYANVLAIFLLISLLMNILFYIRKAHKGDLILMIIQATGLMLTFSRSVWVLWVLSLVVLVSFQEVRKRVVWTNILTVHLISFIVTAILKRDVLFFWSRLRTIQPETSEFRIRLVYWKDSLSMISDYFWLGSGGGGWSVLQPIYQSEQYFVRFVHNHYLQLALDIGFCGALLFIFITIFFYYRSCIHIKSVKLIDGRQSLLWMKGILLMGTLLLLHAGFDFDFSFLLLFGVFLVFVEYVMLESPGRAMVLIHPGKFVKLIISISLVVILSLISWVSVGKYEQTRGQAKLIQGDLLAAIHDYSITQKLIPWAASSYYDMSKAYVLLGNKTNDSNDYLQGKAQIEQAIHRVPQEKLYRTLYEDLDKYFR